MFQQLMPLMPEQPGMHAILIAILGGLVGLVLWIIGARYSRMLVTLLAVAVGGVVGMLAPQWFGSSMNTMATSVGGAVVLGLTGFIFHRIWIGAGLALMLALWGAIGTWTVGGSSTVVIVPSGSSPDPGAAIWSSIPDGSRAMVMIVAGAAAVLGMALAVAWPRVATVLLYSLMGVTLLTLMGLWTIEMKTVDWPKFLPSSTTAQIATLCGLVVFGALVQWQLCPMKKAGRAQPAS